MNKQLRAGTIMLFTLTSAVAGTWLYGYFREKLPH